MRLSRLTTLLCGTALAASPVATPLWPGSAYTARDRDRAVVAGVRYLESVARNPDTLRDYGEDLLWCFFAISSTSADPELRQVAAAAGRDAAARWVAQPRRPSPNADELLILATGAYAAARLGISSPPDWRTRLRREAAAIAPMSALGFDPTQAPPPAGLPLRARYDMWCDALIATYFADTYGVTLGAPYSRVIRWLPAMRPYPAFATRLEFYSLVNAITHTVYTVNRYSRDALNPECLKPEFEFLQAHLPDALGLKDPEIVGEFMDTLRSFGVVTADPRLRPAMEFLLSNQKPDGSWGDPHADLYTRYHATWTAIDGLREYRFKPARACPAFVRY